MLKSTAQLYVVEDEVSMAPPAPLPTTMPVVVVEPETPGFEVVEDQEPAVEVSEPGQPAVVTIVIDDIPGAPPGTKDPVIEVVEEEDESSKKDDNDLKKNDPWSLSEKSFLEWAKTRLDSVPKHSGYDTAGIERAIAYLEKMDSEISKIMRSDIDGKLDADEVKDVREQIDNGISLLHSRLKTIKDSKKKKTKKADVSSEIIKEAQKITGVKGTYVTVPLLISGIARVCINGVVSAGHNLDDIFNQQVKKYKLNDREKSELRFLLLDMGYSLRGDRGYLPDEEYDTSSSDNFDFAANYQA